MIVGSNFVLLGIFNMILLGSKVQVDNVWPIGTVSMIIEIVAAILYAKSLIKRGETIEKEAERIGIIGGVSLILGFLALVTGIKFFGKLFGLTIFVIGTLLELAYIRPNLSMFKSSTGQERVMIICDGATLIVGILVAFAMFLI